MIKYTPLINGEAYSWSTVIVSFLGNVAIDISSINYSDNMEKEDIYGGGINPVKRGYGNYSAEGSITFSMEELEVLQNIAPNGRIQEIPSFNITVSYKPTDDTKITTHKLHNVEFLDNGRQVSQNDKNIELEVNLIISHIDWTP